MVSCPAASRLVSGKVEVLRSSGQLCDSLWLPVAHCGVVTTRGDVTLMESCELLKWVLCVFVQGFFFLYRNVVKVLRISEV